MTSEEYKGLLAKMIAEPDTAQDTATAILEEIGKDFAYLATAKDQIAAGEQKVKDLESKVNRYKAREFLSTFGKPEGEGSDEKKDVSGIDWDTLLKNAEVKDGK